MKRSNSLSLSVSAILSLAVASSASAAVIAPQYTLVSTPIGIASSTYTGTSSTLTLGAPTTPGGGPNNLRFTDWDAYPTNVTGQGVIIEKLPAAQSPNYAVLFDPANPGAGLVPIGPTTPLYGTTGKLNQSISGVSSLGYVSGANSDTNSKAVPWLYVPGVGPTTLGLTGILGTSLYMYNSTTYTQSVSGTAGNGWTVGFATRFGSTGSSLGNDAWYYNPTSASTITIVPQIDTTNYKATVSNSGTYENFTNPVAISASGVIIGASSRVLGLTYASGTPTSYGTDTWLYDAGAATPATSATQIGLLQDTGNTNATYSLTTTTSGTNTNPIRTNAVYTIGTSGIIGGSTTVYSASAFNSTSGTLTWIYNPGTAPGTLNVFYASASNNSFANSSTPGVIGNSTVGTYTRVGLYSDAAHVNAQGLDTSVFQAINPSGQATGLSTIYLTNHTAASGNGDAWAYSPGTGTTLINPVTSSTSFSLQYNNNAGGSNVVVRNATITALNSSGWVAGISQRYDYNYTGTSPTAIVGTNGSAIISSPLGYDAWLYDAANHQTYVVDESVSSSTGLDGYFFSTIEYLSDDGIALGYYTNIPSQSPENMFAYYVDAGGVGHFYSLGTSGFLTNTLASAGWSSLSSLISIDANGNLFGTGTTTSGVNGVFELQAVPEPASLALLALGAVGLVGRRRKA